MSKQEAKARARARRDGGEQIYAIDLLISTARHLSRLHDIGLAKTNGAEYLGKAREMLERLTILHPGRVNKNTCMRIDAALRWG